MPIDAAQPLVGEKCPGPPGKLIVVESLFKQRRDFFTVCFDGLRIAIVLLEGIQGPADILKIANVTAKVIKAVDIPDDNRTILRLHQ